MIAPFSRPRLRLENETAYHEMAARIHELAHTMPGFLGIRSYLADDGERVSIVEFESEETHRAWREHPEHRKAQELGRTAFYAEYQIQVCVVQRQYGFKHRGG